MTAITLNLLAEEQTAEIAEARDPVKTAVAIGCGVISATVMLGSVLFMVAGAKKVQANLAQMRWDDLSASLAAGKGSGYQMVKSQADQVLTINRLRATYAPQLSILKDLIPDNVQLTRLKFELVTETVNVEAGSDDQDLNSGKPKTAAVPKIIQRMAMQMEGKAVGGRPEIEVDAFIKMLRAHAVFSEQVQQIQLRSISRAVGSQEVNGEAAAQFVIDCTYKERK